MTTPSFDDSLSTRLAELTTSAPAMPPTVVASIRARAATQRRRTAGLATAAVIAVAAFGSVGLTHTLATSNAAVAPASTSTTPGLLDWPRRGDWPIEPAKVAADWDAAAHQVHQQVRVLYSGTVGRRVLVVLEGTAAGSGPRIAVLASDNGQIQPGATLSLRAEVSGESAGPVKGLVVRIATDQATSTGVLALAAPGAPRLQVGWLEARPFLTVDGSTGAATAELSGTSPNLLALLGDGGGAGSRELPESANSVPAGAPTAGHVGVMLVT